MMFGRTCYSGRFEVTVRNVVQEAPKTGKKFNSTLVSRRFPRTTPNVSGRGNYVFFARTHKYTKWQYAEMITVKSRWYVYLQMCFRYLISQVNMQF